MRGFVTWGLVRLILATVGLLMGNALTELELAAVAGVVALAWFVGFIQAGLHNEPRFFANLGISPVAIALTSLAPAVLGEIVVGALAAA